MAILSLNDFKINKANFWPGDGTPPAIVFNLTRIVFGLIMFPHALGKFESFPTVLNAGTVKFFETVAGMTPGSFWVGLAATAELVVGVFLTLGIATRWVALGGAAVMAIAIQATWLGKPGIWVWNKGGIEFNTLWMLTYLGIAWIAFWRESKRGK
jgi:putative oxidoreductase